MKSLAGVIAILLAVPSVFAKGAILSSVKGEVDFRASANGEWVQALAGAEIPEGAVVRTGKDGRGKISFPNKSVVWLRPGTSLELRERKDLATRLGLLLGAIKVKVPHLRRKEKFEIDTPSAVAGVRGTILALDTDGKDKTAVDVLFGEARLQRKGNQTAKKGKEPKPFEPLRIAQGFSFDGTKVGLLTGERERGALEDWNPGLLDDQRGAEIRAQLAARSEARSFARASSHTEREQAQIRDRIKSEDFSASRTLVDVHGNLVRLEQRFDRPDADALQILNVVKRTEYQSGGFRRWEYNGDSGARLDVLKVRIEFNQALPETLVELPSFFQDADDLKMDRSEIIFANASDPDNVFAFGFFAQRDSGTDDMDAGVFAGTLETDSLGSGGSKLVNLQKANVVQYGMEEFVPADEEFLGFDTSLGIDSTQGDLWTSSADLWVLASAPATIVPATNQRIWLCSEIFVINNEGKTYNIFEMVGGDYGFDDLLHNTAVETAFFIKADNGANRPSQTEAQGIGFYKNTGDQNIDLVITPDLFVAMARSLASGAGSIGD